MNTSLTGLRLRASYLGATLAAATTLILASPAWALGSDSGALQITRGGQETTGEFGRAGTLITFSARVEADATLTARVQVDDVQLEALFDREKQEVAWTGHGRALFAEHRHALIALAGQLDAALRPDDRTLAPHEDLLRRVVFLWAEAPVGLALDDQTVTAPSPRKAGVRRATGISEPASTLPDATNACYVSDGDGITYFSCSYHYDVVCHDADNGGHCWGCESVPVGCGGGCLGECGPGCSGTNAVTWDCGDHDRCCQAHGGCLNPFDSNCGDEYGEAADDFLFAGANCPSCG